MAGILAKTTSIYADADATIKAQENAGHLFRACSRFRSIGIEFSQGQIRETDVHVQIDLGHWRQYRGFRRRRLEETQENRSARLLGSQ